MRFGVLGTGTVGPTIGGKLAANGHSVMIGTRDVAAAIARTGQGEPSPLSRLLKQSPNVKLGTFAEAAASAEIVFNCTNGVGSLSALKLAGEANIGNKILIDIANPLDFSHGMPPQLSVCNSDSLAEQIQRAFPQAKVVKTLNTVTAKVMVNPALVPGDHDIFVSGNDAGAKAAVTDLLKREFGWKSVIDLGGISTARGAEMLLPIWVMLMGVVGTSAFNFHIAH